MKLKFSFLKLLILITFALLVTFSCVQIEGEEQVIGGEKTEEPIIDIEGGATSNEQDSTIGEEIGEGDLEHEASADRLIRKTQLIKNGNDVSQWSGDSRYYQINAPIQATLTDDEIRVTSLCIDTINNVDVIQDGAVIYNIEKIEFLDEIFITPKDDSKVFIKVNDSNYKKFSSLPSYWHFNMLKQQGANATMNTVVIEGLIKSLTNTLYILTCDLFWDCMNHYEAITGSELHKYARKADYSGMGIDRKYGDRDEGLPMEWDKREPENYKYRIDLKYSEAERAKSKEQFMFDWRLNRDFGANPFLARYTKSGGSGVTFWPSFNAIYVNKYMPLLANGVSARDNEFKQDNPSEMKYPTDEATPVAPVFFHEVCHLVGYWHYSSFPYGEFTEGKVRFFPAVARLLSEMKELPYNFAGNTAKMRPGFDCVTKYIYENPSKFRRQYWQHLHDNIDSTIARYNGFTAELNKNNGLPTWIQAVTNVGAYYTSFEKFLASENDVNMASVIYKPVKVATLPTEFLE